MNWLTQNPIGSMYGPDFLVLYFLVIVCTIIACRIAIQSAIGGSGRGPSITLLPHQPDPYEIAYLRGGPNEVLRLAVFELVRADMLEQTGSTKKLRPTGVYGSVPSTQPAHNLSPFAQAALGGFSTSRAAYEVFSTPAFAQIQSLCRGYAQAAEENGYLVTPFTAARVRRIIGAGVVVILALGIYKLAVALSMGHSNVGFLIILAFVGLIVHGVINKTPRLTADGRAYLKRLQTAFGQVRSRAKQPVAAVDDELLLVGLFSFAALAGTPQAAYARMFGQPASAGGCGTGGGCSSSCSSGGGGGCGGGGGGGGCGGCGGGG